MKQKLLTLVGLTTVLVSSSYSAANAFTWNVSGTVNNDAAEPFTVSGSFTVDNEASLTPIVSGVNITVTNNVNLADQLVFSAPFVAPNNPTINATGTGIDKLIFEIVNGQGGCSRSTNCFLTLFFAPEINSSVFSSNIAFGSSLTGNTEGGNFASAFAGNDVSGTVTRKVVPFNFSTTPGLVVLGLIVGVGKGRKHLPKIKKKIADLLAK